MDPHDAFAVARGIFDNELASLIGSSTSTSSPPIHHDPATLRTPQQQADAPTSSKRSAPTADHSTGKKQKLDLFAEFDTPSSGTPYTPPMDIKLESDPQSSSSPIAETISKKTAKVGGLDISSSAKGQSHRREDEHSRHVHPSRRVLLDRPGAAKLRDTLLSPTSAKPPSPFSRMDGVGSSPTSRGSSAPATSKAMTRVQSSKDTGKTWNTQRNAVQRQWDPRKSDMSYEDLLRLRRSEKVENVDRYVPDYGSVAPAPLKSKPQPQPRPKLIHDFPFGRLPDKARKCILELLLISTEPIKIDFTWLRSFVNGHTRMPSATESITSGDVTYHLPAAWNRVVAGVAQMQNDMQPFKFALEERAAKTRKHRTPCRALTTGLLFVSRAVYREAAHVFYSGNTFWFPWPTSAWMQLESFLATIGPVNTSYLRKLRIHAPLWNRGPQEDFTEGAILDLTSSASRFAVMKPPARDRLLAAVESSVKQLCQSDVSGTTTSLTHLTLDLEHGRMADLWTSRRTSDTSLISISEAEEFTTRKRQGIELLHNLSRSMTKKPLLYVYTTGKINYQEVRNMREKLPAVRREAAKYGWDVDGVLKQKRLF